jgi:ATP-binding cassette, subfamily B, bacterial PglK
MAMTSSLRKLYALFHKRDKIRIVLLLILTTIGSLFEVVGVGVIPGFIATIAVPEKIAAVPVVHSISQYLGIETSTELLVWGGVGLVVFFVCKNGYLAFLHYYKLKLLHNTNVKLSNQLFLEYLHAPYTFHLERNSSELLRNVKKETMNILNGVLYPFMNMLMRVIVLIGIFALLLYVEPFLSIITLFVLSLTGILFLQFTKKTIRRYGKEVLQHRKMVTLNVMQGLGGLKESRVLHRERFFYSKFSYNIVRMALASRYQKYVSKLPHLVIEIVIVLGFLGITFSFIMQGRDIATVIPLLALFGMAAMRMMPAIKEVVSEYTNIQYNIFSIDPVYDDLMLLSRTNRVTKKKIGTEEPPLRFQNSIELKNVTFTYPNSPTPAVENINLTIDKGTAIAFVGPTGAGKTTLVDIILGLLEPDSGSICVDGVDIHRNIMQWQKNVGYIPQFIFMLDDTIRQNIAFGLDEDQIDDEKLKQAVSIAQLDEFVYSLPNRLDTRIGERGVRLSGGQRQRIGIARAIYNDPQVLIMDEATSALDNLTEKYFIEALERLRKDRTIIIIAHRLTTVRNCDRLYYIKNGRVDASGTYDELYETAEDFRLLNTGA